MSVTFFKDDFEVASGEAECCVSAVASLLNCIRRRHLAGTRHLVIAMSGSLDRCQVPIREVRNLLNEVGGVDYTLKLPSREYANAHDAAVSLAESIILSIRCAIDSESMARESAKGVFGYQRLDAERLFSDSEIVDWPGLQKYCDRPEFEFDEDGVRSRLQRERAAVIKLLPPRTPMGIMERRFRSEEDYKREHPDYNPVEDAAKMRAAHVLKNPDDPNVTQAQFADARKNCRKKPNDEK